MLLSLIPKIQILKMPERNPLTITKECEFRPCHVQSQRIDRLHSLFADNHSAVKQSAIDFAKRRCSIKLRVVTAKHQQVHSSEQTPSLANVFFCVTPINNDRTVTYILHIPNFHCEYIQYLLTQPACEKCW